MPLGAHLLLFLLISVNDDPRNARRSGEPPVILFLVELPTPEETQPSTHSSSQRPGSAYDSLLDNRATRDTAISLPPEIVGAQR